MTASLSIGVAGSLGPARIARIATAAEGAGFDTLWVNDTPGADALEALRAAAATTATLRLATGVLPLDRRTVPEIAAEVADLPQERVTLGVGSGQARAGALALVEAGVRGLRDATGCRILVGALGPRMRRLGAAVGDGVLLSWLPPAVAGEQALQAHEVSAAAHVALYVRTALDPAALPRLDREAARYAALGQYAANLARIGAGVAETVVPTPDGDVDHIVAAYRAAVDEVVLRAIVADDVEADYLAFIAQAAALR